VAHAGHDPSLRSDELHVLHPSGWTRTEGASRWLSRNIVGESIQRIEGALEAAGNSEYTTILLPRAAHNLTATPEPDEPSSEYGCVNEVLLFRDLSLSAETDCRR
jgi:hypothetical protein